MVDFSTKYFTVFYAYYCFFPLIFNINMWYIMFLIIITRKGGHKNSVFVTAGSPAGLIKVLTPLKPLKDLVIVASFKIYYYSLKH